MTWDELHARDGFAPKYPEPEVVRWTLKNFKRGDRLLDIGCGHGRHAIMWAENEYRSYACDYSEVAVSKLPLTITDVAVCPCYDLPFHDGSMDGALAWGVYYYCEPDLCVQSVSELRRVLKKGGKALVVLRTKWDSRFNGERPEAEKSMELLFHDEIGLRGLFGRFSTKIGRMTRTEPSGYVHDDWLCYLEKP